MGLVKILDATAEPFELAVAKRHLREDLVDAANDDDIKALILVARLAAEDRTGRTLLPTTWELALDGFPACIELPRPPLLSVTSVRYVDAAGVQQTLPASAYLVDASAEPGRLVPAYGSSWPATRSQPGAVVVRFQAGYADAAALPAPIKQWMKLAMGDMYQRRTRSSDKPAVPQSFADSLLDLYKVWSI